MDMSGRMPAVDAAGAGDASERPRWSRVQVLLHWTVVGLVVVQWLTYDAIMRTHSSLMRPRPIDLLEHAVHTWSGIAIGVLMVARLALRMHRGRNAIHVHFRERAAAVVHSGLYLALLAQAASGFTARYLWGGAAFFHVWIWKVILVLLALHVLGAVFHLVRRDGVVGGMLPRRRAVRGAPRGKVESVRWPSRAPGGMAS